MGGITYVTHHNSFRSENVPNTLAVLYQCCFGSVFCVHMKRRNLRYSESEQKELASVSDILEQTEKPCVKIVMKDELYLVCHDLPRALSLITSPQIQKSFSQFIDTTYCVLYHLQPQHQFSDIGQNGTTQKNNGVPIAEKIF